MSTSNRVLYIVVCGAGPAGEVGRLVTLAQQHGWTVQLIATQAAATHFLDIQALHQQTGRPVRTTYRPAGDPAKMADADALIVAPATYNTINKWAAGIADTYPLSVLAELTGLGLPVAVLPFVNQALAANQVFSRSVEELRAAGVTVLLGAGAFEPHPPRTGGTKVAIFPWELALESVS